MLSINVRLLNEFKNLNGVINKSPGTLETLDLGKALIYPQSSEEVGQVCEAIL